MNTHTAISGAIVAFGAFVISAIAAWLTHIFIAIAAMTSGAPVAIGYGILLAVGAVFPPVGAIHGYGVWFGAW